MVKRKRKSPQKVHFKEHRYMYVRTENILLISLKDSIINILHTYVCTKPTRRCIDTPVMFLGFSYS